MNAAVVKPLADQLLKPGTSGLLFSAAIIGGVNLIGFGLTAVTKSHKFTDLFGTGAFVASAAATAYVNRAAIAAAPVAWPRSAILSVAVGVWGTRLATHLFERIMKSPHDPRLAAFLPEKDEPWLDKNKSNFPLSLAGFWSIQAAWAWIVSLPVTMANFNPIKGPLGLGGRIAMATFAGGFLFESIADWQKRQFRNDESNNGKWCDIGLWSVSRHPNYFGEMTVWWSIFAAAVPALRGRTQLALGVLSPVFVSTLLLYVSGIPMLEEKMEDKYKGDAAYAQYKSDTPLLIPGFKGFRLPGLPH